METRLVLKNKSADTLRRCVLSFGFVGFLPHSPGTWGSIAMALVLALIRFGFPMPLTEGAVTAVILAGLFLIAGVICVKGLKRKTGISIDQQWIVLDEAVGVTIALLPIFFVTNAWMPLIAGLVFFRFFDILKPLGIKKIDRMHTAWSVFLDDVAAGIAALLCNIVLIEILSTFSVR